MKTLTLSGKLGWDECFSLWTWIVEQLDENPSLSIIELKHLWLVENSYNPETIIYPCFSCENRLQQGDPTLSYCSNSAGQRITLIKDKDNK